MLKANTHLHFNGRCLEAFKFYEKCLGGKITFSLTWGESPAAKQVPAEWAGKIIHASFEFDGQMLSGDDAPPGSYCKPQGFQVVLDTTDVAQAEKIFKALSEKGEIRMTFAKTFWSPGFGMLLDQFGTPWMVNCSDPAMSKGPQ
jgi:PhnB protein